MGGGIERGGIGRNDGTSTYFTVCAFVLVWSRGMQLQVIRFLAQMLGILLEKLVSVSGIAFYNAEITMLKVVLKVILKVINLEQL